MSDACNLYKLRDLARFPDISWAEGPELAAIVLLLITNKGAGRFGSNVEFKSTGISIQTVEALLKVAGIDNREHEDIEGEIFPRLESMKLIRRSNEQDNEFTLLENACSVAEDLSLSLSSVKEWKPSSTNHPFGLGANEDALLSLLTKDAKENMEYGENNFYEYRETSLTDDEICQSLDLNKDEVIAAERRLDFLDFLEGRVRRDHRMLLMPSGFQRGLLLEQMNLFEASRLAPASDRIVQLNDNSNEVVEIKSELDRLVRAVEGINDPTIISDESKQLNLVDLDSIRKIFTAKRVSLGVITTIVLPVLYGVGSILQDAASTTIALHLISLIKSLAGI